MEGIVIKYILNTFSGNFCMTKALRHKKLSKKCVLTNITNERLPSFKLELLQNL